MINKIKVDFINETNICQCMTSSENFEVNTRSSLIYRKKGEINQKVVYERCVNDL